MPDASTINKAREEGCITDSLVICCIGHIMYTDRAPETSRSGNGSIAPTSPHLSVSLQHSGYEYFREMCKHFRHDSETPHPEIYLQSPLNMSPRKPGPSLSPLRRTDGASKHPTKENLPRPPLVAAKHEKSDTAEEAELRKYLHSPYKRRDPAAGASASAPYSALTNDAASIDIPDCTAVFAASPARSLTKKLTLPQRPPTPTTAHTSLRSSTAISSSSRGGGGGGGGGYSTPKRLTKFVSKIGSRNGGGPIPGCYSTHTGESGMERKPAAARSSSRRPQPEDDERHHSRTIVEIEMVPGVYVQYFGVEETRQARRTGRLVCCTCFNCSETLFCTALATSVLCPSCRDMSPILTSADGGFGESGVCGSGGVGLGAFESDINKWRDEDLIQQSQQLPRDRPYYDQSPRAVAQQSVGPPSSQRKQPPASPRSPFSRMPLPVSASSPSTGRTSVESYRRFDASLCQSPRDHERYF